MANSGRRAEAGLALEEWRAEVDDRVCGACLTLDRAVFFPGDGPQPPLHPHCPCTRERVVASGPRLVRRAVEARRHHRLGRQIAERAPREGRRIGEVALWGMVGERGAREAERRARRERRSQGR